MPNTQKKFLKKKEREKKVKVKLAKRREAIRAQAAERTEQEKQWEFEFELKNGKREPILNDPAAIAAREERKKAQVQERLNRNLAILEALESEYDKEHEGRERVQKNLEAEGHKSIKDKLAALHAKAKSLQSMTEALKEYAGKEPTGCTVEETSLRVREAKGAEEIVREELTDDGKRIVSGSALCKPAKGLACSLYDAAAHAGDKERPAIEGHTPERVVEAKAAEEVVREELAS